MNKTRLTKISTSLDLILRKIADVKFKCLIHQDSMKLLHSELQTLLNTHEKHPKIFNTHKKIRDRIETSIRSLNGLSIDIENNYSIRLHDMETILQEIRYQVSETPDLLEFYFLKININAQLDIAEQEINQVIKIREQLKSYIDYHIRSLEALNTGSA
jgi:hypothetical protein